MCEPFPFGVEHSDGTLHHAEGMVEGIIDGSSVPESLGPLVAPVQRHGLHNTYSLLFCIVALPEVRIHR